MARNKNSPALFEVIRNAQQKQKEQAERQRQQALAAEIHAQSPATGLLMSPIYWFKGKLAHEQANDGPAAPAAKPTPVMREIPKTRQDVKRTPPPQPPTVDDMPQTLTGDTDPLRAGPIKLSDLAVLPPTPTDAGAEPVVPEVVRQVEVAAPAAAPASVPVYTPAPASAGADALRQMREELAAQEAPAAEPAYHTPDDDNRFNPSSWDDDGEPTAARGFQFSYTTVAVAGFAIVMAFAVAYIIGSHNRGNQLASKTPDTAAARPEVLHVGPTATDKPVVKDKQPDADDVIVDNSRANLNTTNDLGLAGIGKPIAVPTGVKRVVGMHYVVLQSFPSDYDAQELVKFLAQNGVPATSERPLPGYAPRWSSVITTRGFDHVKNNPALDAYMNAVSGVLKKYAAEQGGLKKNFKLDLYKWKTAAK